jgi:hypothetical protein
MLLVSSAHLDLAIFALEWRAIADPALVVAGLLSPLFMSQGPSRHVKHRCSPFESCTQFALPDFFGALSPPGAKLDEATSATPAAKVRLAMSFHTPFLHRGSQCFRRNVSNIGCDARHNGIRCDAHHKMGISP